MRQGLLIAVAVIGSLLANGTELHAAATTATSAEPSTACDALRDARMPRIRVREAERIAATADTPAYCRVAGEIQPSVGFEIRMPLPAAWNGRFLVSGCGAYCGTVLPDQPGMRNAIQFAVKRGYAAITADAGHRGAASTDLSWARDNPKAERLYAHAWVPAAAEGGRALLRRFYGRRESRSYFSGCSNGGRTALKTAQFYPRLFDGIAAGCSGANAVNAAGVLGAWFDRTLFDSSGILTLARSKVPRLQAAVLAQCDALDGRKDGLVSAPRRCDFDPGELRCAEAPGKDGAPAESDCLTAAEVEVVRRLYSGPRRLDGSSIYPGLPRGSEPDWNHWLLGTSQAGRPHVADLGTNYLRYIGFPKDPALDYSSREFDLETDIPKLAAQGRLFNATDPDLRRFRDAGGKLLMYHGLADGLTIADESIRYVESVVAELGGRQHDVDPFLRLFLVPGAGHCASDFDPLLVLERWVEQGIAPDSIRVQRSSTATAPESFDVCAYRSTGPTRLESPIPEADGECAARLRR
jgi:feruloyl esterase